MLAFSVPPGYRRSQPPVRAPSWILHRDHRCRSWRQTDQRGRASSAIRAKRIFERLRAEHGFAGGYTIVKDYVRERRARAQEMFVPLAHPPGHAQADFGEAVGGDRRGASRRSTSSALDLPHTDACFVQGLSGGDGRRPSATGTTRPSPSSAACRCRSSTTTPSWRWRGSWATARGSGTRAFAELQSHYLFQDRFGRPGKGNDKGKVEGLVGYARRNFLVPIPDVPSFAALNEQLEQRCLERLDAPAARPRGDDRRAAGAAISPPCRRCRRCPTTPARRKAARVSLAVAGALSTATTTRCRPPTATARCWCRAMWTRW